MFLLETNFALSFIVHNNICLRYLLQANHEVNTLDEVISDYSRFERLTISHKSNDIPKKFIFEDQSDRYASKSKQNTVYEPNIKEKSKPKSKHSSNITDSDDLSKEEEKENIYQDSDSEFKNDDNSSVVTEEEKGVNPDTSSSCGDNEFKIIDYHSREFSSSYDSRSGHSRKSRSFDYKSNDPSQQKSSFEMTVNDIKPNMSGIPEKDQSEEKLSKISEFDGEKLDKSYKELNTQI